jgi:hypothetical protein
MHKIEPDPSGRAACRGCKQHIPKGALRFAEEFQNPYSEEGGTSYRYWHLACAAVKLANELDEALAQQGGPVEDRESIEALIREHLRAAPAAEPATRRSRKGSCGWRSSAASKAPWAPKRAPPTRTPSASQDIWSEKRSTDASRSTATKRRGA